MIQRYCIRPRRDAAYAAVMENVIAVYTAPPDPNRPVVCFDEGGKELRADQRQRRPPRPGQPAQEDYAFVRRGVANLFVAVAPHLGTRFLWSSARRTAVDFAHAMRHLVDDCFPDAEQLVLVLDNLNTHTTAALYTAFPPAEACRIASRLDFHYTPKHGSWMNLAEVELAALQRMCLNQRIADRATLDRYLATYVARRNAEAKPIRWRFTLEEARSNLHTVYPIIEPDKHD